MSGFEMLFALFSLLIGLAMAEILGDLGRVLDRRDRIRIGWLTPLLAVLVLCDLASFWQSAYDYRSVLSDSDYALLAIVLFAGTYYLIATLVIPQGLPDGHDLDSHYYKNNRIVIGGMILLNLLQIPLAIGVGFDAANWAVVAIFYASLLGLWFVQRKRANIAMLIVSISIYFWAPLALRLIH